MTDVYQSGGTQRKLSGTAITAAGGDALETFLATRAIEPEIAIKYGLIASDGHIEFPYVYGGEIINRKYRGISEKKFWQDGGKQIFWNYDAILDCLSVIQAGYSRAVSVPNGAGSGLAYLDDCENVLRSLSEIILAVDNDDKGAQLLHELSMRLGKARCKWVKYPKGCKDMNDALVRYGVRGVQETIKRAAWIRVDGIYKLSDLPPIPRPQSFPIEVFDCNIRLGDFSVLTGIPGHGKTTFVNDVLSRIASKNNLRIAIASFEQPPQTDHRRNLRTWHCGKFEKYMNDAETQVADEWIDQHYRFIVPDHDDDVTLDWLLEKAAAAVIREGVKILVIDPWNEMDHHRPNSMSLTEYVGFAIKQFKRFAKKYAVHVCVVAHPAKMLRSKDGVIPIPGLYDISDSAHWANKPDLGLVVHRSEDGDIVRICKSRYHNEIGVPGDHGVKFFPHTGRYLEVDNEAYA